MNFLSSNAVSFLTTFEFPYLVDTDHVIERLIARLCHMHVGGSHELGVRREVKEAVYDDRDEEPFHGELHQTKQLLVRV